MQTQTITIVNLINRDESTDLITVRPQSRRNLNYYTGYVRKHGYTRLEDGVVGWDATHIVYFDDADGYPIVALATIA